MLVRLTSWRLLTTADWGGFTVFSLFFFIFFSLRVIVIIIRVFVRLLRIRWGWGLARVRDCTKRMISIMETLNETYYSLLIALLFLAWAFLVFFLAIDKGMPTFPRPTVWVTPDEVEAVGTSIAEASFAARACNRALDVGRAELAERMLTGWWIWLRGSEVDLRSEGGFGGWVLVLAEVLSSAPTVLARLASRFHCARFE